jgi:hypothetical protein
LLPVCDPAGRGLGCPSFTGELRPCGPISVSTLVIFPRRTISSCVLLTLLPQDHVRSLVLGRLGGFPAVASGIPA